MKKHPSPLRRAVGLVLTLLLTLGYFSPTQQALRALPASLRLTQDEPISLLTGMLRASGEGLEVSASQDETLSQYVSVTGQKSGTSELLLSILGIPLRRVEVEISPEKRLIPGGQALGVAMRTDGVLIVGLSDVKKGVCPARDCGLQPGDVLLRIGGHAIERVSDVSEIAQQNGTSPCSSNTCATVRPPTQPSPPCRMTPPGLSASAHGCATAPRALAHSPSTTRIPGSMPRSVTPSPMATQAAS